MRKLTMTYRLMSMIVLLSLNWGCTPHDPVKREGRMLIVTTTGLIADAAKNIVGQHADVVSLMGPGVDPHLYKATHGDVNTITAADVLLYNGLHLEGKMGSVFEKTSASKTVVEVSKDIPRERLRTAEGFSNTYDPHIWFDVKLWKTAVITIKDVIIAKDSAHADAYEINCQRYVRQLDSLDLAIRHQLNQLPQDRRVLITAHDAFGYFGDAYGIEVRGLQGISTLAEFGLRDVTTLVNFIIERKIPAIFPETSVSEKFVNAIIEGCREKGWNVRTGHSLYSDALGNTGTAAGTYLGMMDANIKTIVNALR